MGAGQQTTQQFTLTGTNFLADGPPTITAMILGSGLTASLNQIISVTNTSLVLSLNITTTAEFNGAVINVQLTTCATATRSVIVLTPTVTKAKTTAHFARGIKR